MAIIDPTDTYNLVTANYSKVIKVEFNFEDKIAFIYVAQYKNKAAREAKRPLYIEMVSIPFRAFAQNPGVTFYTLLKNWASPQNPFAAKAGDADDAGTPAVLNAVYDPTPIPEPVPAPTVPDPASFLP
jgi:hypothetical protein